MSEKMTKQERMWQKKMANMKQTDEAAKVKLQARDMVILISKLHYIPLQWGAYCSTHVGLPHLVYI